MSYDHTDFCEEIVNKTRDKYVDIFDRSKNFDEVINRFNELMKDPMMIIGCILMITKVGSDALEDKIDDKYSEVFNKKQCNHKELDYIEIEKELRLAKQTCPIVNLEQQINDLRLIISKMDNKK